MTTSLVPIERIIAAGYRLGLLLALLAASTLLHAQAPQPDPTQPQRTAVPTVTFTFDWPSIEPHRYVISVDSSGNAAYHSWTADPRAEQSSVGDPYLLKFTMSAAARDRIFALARQLKYFNGDFQYHKHRVAFTGDKTLAYADPDKQYETRYNWSENAGIGELTALFQGMSPTIESGRRLERLRRFDRLGLDAELKSLEHLAVERQATELQLIAPILGQLAGDPGVMNIARQRARHILQVAGVPPSAGAEASPQ
ncbi:MAG TPA: hypothetical protein VES66_02430 [Terriglobales bacterium]|nr:hypothetical protein [Terriglobales bacterium]